MTQFWLNDPSVLLNKDQITEVWPNGQDSLERKMNAITRIIILLGFLGFLITKSMKIPISALISLVAIVIMYKTQKKKQHHNKKHSKIVKEGFTNPELYKATKDQFQNPTKENPLMNVSLPEIKYNPKRKAAAPAFNPEVEKEINEKAGYPQVDPRLFEDLGDKIKLEQSMRQFYSNPNTKIPNDQKAFGDFCYGDMPSCKEGHEMACEKHNIRWINY
jgi:ABC-type transport system substrate-binding protein